MIELNNKRILVEVITPKYEGKVILLTPIDNDRFIKGKVIDISNDCESVGKGDYIAFSPSFGTAVTIDDKNYIILYEEDIQLIINKEDKVK